jgi:hypothetical protein
MNVSAAANPNQAAYDARWRRILDLVEERRHRHVDAEIKRLVELVWNKGGKLMLDCAFGLPDETRVENVRAMFAAGRKYAG